MTRHCDVSLSPPHPRGWNSTAGLVPEGHRILVYDQELEKGEFRECIRLYFLLVCEPCFAELGLGSATASTSRRADKTSTSAIRIQCHLNSPFFSNPIRHNDAI